MTIGKLAGESGVGVETVRFYEREGLIQRPLKRVAGYRQYAGDDVKRIQFIRRSQELGFSLKEIKELLELNTSRRATCSDIKTRTDRKLEEVEAKLRDLKAMKKTLERLSDSCGDARKAASECRILDCFSSGWKC